MPAGAVIQKPRALPGFTGRKGCVGGVISLASNLRAQPEARAGNGHTRGSERCVELKV